jgi:F-type H+-transporting ATPase subunit gamma
MTERLADITVRIAGIRQLGAVVNAMRGIAAARVQQARGQLEAVDRYAATIANAIGRALALAPPAPPRASKRPGRPAVVLFCAEQGFAGAFSERVLDAAGPDLAGSKVFLIGTRGLVAAAERSIAIDWSSQMPSHSAGIPKLADVISGALYTRIANGEIDRLNALFSQTRQGHSIHVERRQLFPYDMKQFSGPLGDITPLVNLPPALLLSELTADYLHAQLCEAALHAFAAENQARMEAMAAARNQIDRQLEALQATQRRVRQEEITEEIIELAAGETANRRHRN